MKLIINGLADRTGFKKEYLMKTRSPDVINVAISEWI